MKKSALHPASMLVTFLAFTCLVSLFITACKKGDTGPAGPKGSANFIYSDGGPAISTSYKDSVMDNSNVKIARLNAPQIVDSILAKGVVLVYMSFSNSINQLPYTSYAGNKVSTLSFNPALKSILLYRFTHDNSGSLGISTVVSFRYIIIPGGVPNGRMSRPDYKNMSYEEVCAFLGIPQ